jgi:hypothetical protein
MEYVETIGYLDDLLIVTNSSFRFKYHLLKLEKLSTTGMTLNISKSKFFAEKIEYLGYWITRKVFQPISNKVEAILNDKIKKVIGTKVHICYPDFNKHLCLYLYTNASDHLLGIG